MKRAPLLAVLFIVAAGLLAAPAGAAPTDAWTAVRVKLALCADPLVQGVDVGDLDVRVEGPVVVLRGRVATLAARRAAAAAAARASGGAVRDELVVVPGALPTPPQPDRALQRTLGRVLAREPGLSRVHVHGTVHDGVAYLTGRVPDVSTRVLASEVARRVPGVSAVPNDLFPERLRL